MNNMQQGFYGQQDAMSCVSVNKAVYPSRIILQTRIGSDTPHNLDGF